MQKITHGKGNTFDSIPRVHGYPGVTVITGYRTHRQSRAGNEQNDEGNNQNQYVFIFHDCSIMY